MSLLRRNKQPFFSLIKFEQQSSTLFVLYKYFYILVCFITLCIAGWLRTGFNVRNKLAFLSEIFQSLSMGFILLSVILNFHETVLVLSAKPDNVIDVNASKRA
jgi:hypothetical protein